MPRKNRQYSEENLQAAIERIQDGSLSYGGAAQFYGVPIGTLHRQMKKPDVLRGFGKVGPPTALREDEEEALIHHIIVLGDYGIPMDVTDLRLVFTKYRVSVGLPSKY